MLQYGITVDACAWCTCSVHAYTVSPCIKTNQVLFFGSYIAPPHYTAQHPRVEVQALSLLIDDVSLGDVTAHSPRDNIVNTVTGDKECVCEQQHQRVQ